MGRALNDELRFHLSLLGDRERVAAYRRAIGHIVRAGDVVLDVGTGTGILALIAADAGAARVYAVEREPIAEVARSLARVNGPAGRICLLRADATEIQLPERVDVIVSELLSPAMVGQAMVETLGRCRDRFLAPGGRMIPAAVEVLCAPVEGPASLSDLPSSTLSSLDLDLTPLDRLTVQRPRSETLEPDWLLGPPRRAFRYEALLSEPAPGSTAELTLPLERCGTLRGFGLWFEATLGGGSRLTNEPPSRGCWDQLFLPLPSATVVDTRATVQLELQAHDSQAKPLFWRWATSVDPGSPDGVPIAFDQSSFFGELCPRPGSSAAESA